MSSRRSIIVLIAIAVALGTLFVAVSQTVSRLYARQVVSKADDLEWLRAEFKLSDAELQRVRQLHEGYLPKCQEMCARIAAKKLELEAALAAGQGVTPEAEQKLAEVAALRAQCQTHMLQHFYETSKAMPPEQGRHYLAEMQRLTLGFHEQIEHSMSEPKSCPHGH